MSDPTWRLTCAYCIKEFCEANSNIVSIPKLLFGERCGNTEIFPNEVVTENHYPNSGIPLTIQNFKQATEVTLDLEYDPCSTIGQILYQAWTVQIRLDNGVFWGIIGDEGLEKEFPSCLLPRSHNCCKGWEHWSNSETIEEDSYYYPYYCFEESVEDLEAELNDDRAYFAHNLGYGRGVPLSLRRIRDTAKAGEIIDLE